MPILKSIVLCGSVEQFQSQSTNDQHVTAPRSARLNSLYSVDSCETKEAAEDRNRTSVRPLKNRSDKMVCKLRANVRAMLECSGVSMASAKPRSTMAQKNDNVNQCLRLLNTRISSLW
ncbi:hypothetical protein V9T40_014485 [Parthenolecanium corni]|uniref:Uncharacterized protein n=1 Tax=Parthenolecanium corni TaxID=536013 RepID=A0AAN9T3A5_9HEMI